MAALILIILFCIQIILPCINSIEAPELLLVTVATEETDGLRRLRNSANQFGNNLHILGLGEKWRGGDMHYTGGGQKIMLLRDAIIKYKDRDDLLILFVDGYDVIINADPESIIRSFFHHFSEYKIVFGAEPYCWPDRALALKYPQVVFGDRFLNSGMFMGYANQLFQLLSIVDDKQFAENDDDQLFYTNLYIDPTTREKFAMGLDSLSILFQNLNGADEYASLQFDNGKPELYNKLYNTHPAIIHGNGPSKIRLNEHSNYLLTSASHDITQENYTDTDLLPTVCIAIFVMKPIPYVEEFLKSISQLDYPKEKILLQISNNQPYNRELIDEFANQWEENFLSIQLFNLDERKEHNARSKTLEWSEEKNADFLLVVDADAHLTNPLTLKHLILKSKASDNDLGIISPLLLRPETLYSNFWGAISESGYYERSFDYVNIVSGNRLGIWNVPFISSAILISKHKFSPLRKAYNWNMGIDADMAFAEFCRNNGHFLYIDAETPNFYGFIVNADTFSQFSTEELINLEIYDFLNNKKLWEDRYIHPDYFPLLKPENPVPMACPDVYDFPFLSERFCKEIIEVMEHYGSWSDGTHNDNRLDGGYENVPTRDIHMKQVALEKQWLKVLDMYIAPIQEKTFIGFYQRPIHSNMMFVVRYRPTEQSSLGPHHDASTYSIDVALNIRGIDYEGGGVRFIRYNCTIAADKIGWTMLFPGRLTHMHEGLPTTNGTRYILVSFINP